MWQKIKLLCGSLVLGLCLTGCSLYKVKEEYQGPAFWEETPAEEQTAFLTVPPTLSAISSQTVYGQNPSSRVAEDRDSYYLRNPLDGCIYQYDKADLAGTKLSEMPADKICCYGEDCILSLSFYWEDYAPGIYQMRKDGTQLKQLSAVVPTDMQVVNDFLYYSGDSGEGLYRMHIPYGDVLQLTAERVGSFLVLQNEITYAEYVETDAAGIKWFSFKRIDVDGALQKQSPYLYSFGDFAYDGEGLIATDYYYHEIYFVDLSTLLANLLCDACNTTMPALCYGENILYVDAAEGGRLTSYNRETQERTIEKIENVQAVSIFGEYMLLEYVQNGQPRITVNNMQTKEACKIF